MHSIVSTMPGEVFSTEECHECPDERQVRRIFLAVLLRAIRDLESGPQHVRREAREWFESEERTLPDGISYQDIICSIELEASLTDKIQRLVYGEFCIKQVA